MSKCDELIATSSGEIRARDSLLGYWWLNKNDVDAAIAELKADNERLLSALNEAVAKQGFRNLNIPESLARLMGQLADAKGENRRQQHEIAELKADNERLKNELDRSEEIYAIRRKKLRATRRALWLARAERARSSALSYHLVESHPDKDAAATYKRKANKWEKVKAKCRAKAEEYK